MYSLDEVKSVDPEIASCIVKEEERQNSHIELIASENWVSCHGSHGQPIDE